MVAFWPTKGHQSIHEGPPLRALQVRLRRQPHSVHVLGVIDF
jgi:hypothetical protein